MCGCAQNQWRIVGFFIKSVSESLHWPFHTHSSAGDQHVTLRDKWNELYRNTRALFDLLKSAYSSCICHMFPDAHVIKIWSPSELIEFSERRKDDRLFCCRPQKINSGEPLHFFTNEVSLSALEVCLCFITSMRSVCVALIDATSLSVRMRLLCQTSMWAHKHLRNDFLSSHAWL